MITCAPWGWGWGVWPGDMDLASRHDVLVHASSCPMCPARTLEPRDCIVKHTLHTFGSIGHDAAAGIPKDLFASPGPAAYPTLEGAEEEALLAASTSPGEGEEEGGSPRSGGVGGTRGKLHAPATLSARRLGSQALALVLRRAASSRGGVKFSSADKDREARKVCAVCVCVGGQSFGPANDTGCHV
jgi:hypothetical protein